MLSRNSSIRAGLTRFGGVLTATILLASGLNVAQAPIAAAAPGTTLVNLPLNTATVADPHLSGLDTACLTAATTERGPAGSSNLGKCKRTVIRANGADGHYLQLTNDDTITKGAVVYNRAIPGNAGLKISFDQYQFSNDPSHADGISFFLVDGRTDLTSVGAYGGSLGYTQDNSRVGINGGYLGVGLDAYGNFAWDHDGRGSSQSGSGCPANTQKQTGNSVTLRGPGQGFKGYCHLKTESLKAHGINIAAANRNASKHRVDIEVTGETRPKVTVKIDGKTIINQYQMNAPAPKTWKFGLAASTGGNFDNHLIGNLKVETLKPLDNLSISKEVINPKTSYRVGETVNYRFLVTNAGLEQVKNLKVIDPKIPNVSCSRTTLSNVPPNNTVECTGSYVITKKDAQSPNVTNPSLTNTAKAQAQDPYNKTLTSASDSASVRITPVPRIALQKTAALNDANKNGRADAGETVDYTFKVTNTGDLNLTNVRITDPFSFTSAIKCPKTSLNYDESMTCSATYKLTQANIDANTLTNTAKVEATSPGNYANPSASSTARLNLAKPALTVTKTATPNANPSVGQTVTYKISVTNSGNVTMKDVTATDPLLGTAWKCSLGTLTPGQTKQCANATYKVTQGDVDAGKITNTATATGTDPQNVKRTASGKVDVNIKRESAVRIQKSAQLVDTNKNGRQDAGETIKYTFTVTNNGNVTLNSLAVSDPKTGGVTCPVTSLAPKASTTCTGKNEYKLTQADINAGKVSNTAKVTANGTHGGSVSHEVTQTTTITPKPAISVTKSATPSSAVKARDQIKYTFTVKNDGNVTLTNVSIADAKTGGATCNTTTLAPGTSTSCRGTKPYTVVQADVDRGSVVNEATASAKTPAGANVTSTKATSTVSAVAPAPKLTVTKSANPASAVKAGDQIKYTFTVKNDGNVTLSGLALSDAKTNGAKCAATTLAPGASTTCNGVAAYKVTEQDVIAGKVVNDATATAKTPKNVPVTGKGSVTVNTVAANANLSVTKVASPASGVKVGSQIQYTITVKNTGTLTVSGIKVTDPKLGAGWTCTVGDLAPGATGKACTGNYTVTQADVDNGQITNTATASGKASNATTVTRTGTATTKTVAGAPAISITKSASAIVDTNGTKRNDAGDTITYSFKVTNGGNVTLNGVTVKDPLLGANWSCSLGALKPGENKTCTGNLTLTQALVDAGKAENTATATGKPVVGNSVTATSNKVTSNITPAPQLSLKKTTNKTDPVKLGEVITYTFTVQNTGNVTIKGVTVDDPKIKASCSLGDLAPNTPAKTCTGAYRVTQADIDAGKIDNTATTKGTDPAGKQTAGTASVSTRTVTAAPKLTLTKSADKTAGVKVGDTITYTFTAKNDGNVTMNNVKVIDPLLGGGWSCTIGKIDVGKTGSCTGKYVVKQSDVDAGKITNTASVTGQTPGGQTTTPSTGKVEVTTEKADPKFELVKTASKTTGVKVNEKITYTFKVTNTGNVTMANVVVKDPLLGANWSCTIKTLPVKGSDSSCKGDYVVKQSDIDAGKITNTATVTGTTPSGTTTQPTPGTVNVTTETASPKLTLTKTADKTAGVKVGDTITYTFTAKNDGNVTMNNVKVTDPLLGSGWSCTIGKIDVGKTGSCTGKYVVKQSDVDAGKITNTASVTGQTPGGQTTTPSTGKVEVTTEAPKRSLTMQKQAVLPAGQTTVKVGDKISYNFIVTNTGNVTVTNVNVDDAKTGGANCSTDPLLPGKSMTCTGKQPYTVTQSDVDAGKVTNIATVKGDTPGGTTTQPSEGKIDVPTVPANPVLEVTKQAKVEGRKDKVAVGDKISYTFEVKNIGNVTAGGVSITDEKTNGAECPIGDIAPGESIICTGKQAYTVTQADVDAGKVTNVATVTATKPDGTVNNVPGTNEVPTVDAAPAMTFEKQALPNGITGVKVNQQITYKFVIKNTGNVTLNDIEVSDPMTKNATCPKTSLAPNESTECSGVAAHAVTQAEVDTGKVVNTAKATAKSANGAALELQAVSEVQTEAGKPALKVDKSADKTSGVKVGDEIKYNFVVTNTGNVTVNDVTVDDDKTNGAKCEQTTLSPGQTTKCAGNKAYVVTQADFDAGKVSNTATAKGSSQSGDPAAPTPGTIDVTTEKGNPELKLTKVGTPRGGKTTVEVDDVIDYKFTVENVGNVTIKDVIVNDEKLGTTWSCAVGELKPGATSDKCTGSYTVTQADVDAGKVLNAATATGTNPGNNGGQPTTQTPGESTVPTVDPKPESQLEKTFELPAGKDKVEVGDDITYKFKVTNTGNVTLSNLVVKDAKLGADWACAVGTLEVGQSHDGCTGKYTVTQADVDAGTVKNSATVAGTTPGGTQTGPSTGQVDVPTVTGDPKLELVKDAVLPAGQTEVKLGDHIRYNFTAKNTGNVTIKGVVIKDEKLGADWECKVGDLAPGTENTDCFGVYTVTQDDIDAGKVSNTATAIGTKPANSGENPGGGNGGNDDPKIETPGTKDVPTVQREPKLELTKTADITNVKAGDVITYTFAVKNVGNVTMDKATVTDQMLGDQWNCEVTEIGVGQTKTCTGTYTVTAEDIDRGSIKNVATVTGSGPGGASTPSTGEIETKTEDAKPALFVSKKAVLQPGQTFVKLGEEVNYEFTVMNTGNVTVDGIVVNDVKTDGATCPSTALPAGASMICKGTKPYKVTQADLDAGQVVNNVAVTGTGAQDKPTDPTTGTVETPTEPAKPSMKLVKTAAQPDGKTEVGVGDKIEYTFTVTNDGNVTLSDVVVSDQKLGGFSCAVGVLAPGESSSTCRGEYIVAQADVDAGQVLNSATATAKKPGDTTGSAETTGTNEFPTIKGEPKLELNKQADKQAGVKVDDEIKYTFTVTNTGNVSASNVVIKDPKLGDRWSCSVGELAPGQSFSACPEAIYKVTQADVDAGKVVNVATVTGNNPGNNGGNPKTTTPGESSVPTVDPVSTMTLDKQALTPNGKTEVELGDEITYKFVVTNTGNVTLNKVVVTDPKLGAGFKCEVGSLAPGAKDESCTGVYKVTQADIDAGKVSNTATAVASKPNTGGSGGNGDPNDPGTGDDDEVITPGTVDVPTVKGEPKLEMTKTADKIGNVKVGETITYTFTVKNSGTVTIDDVKVNDQKLGSNWFCTIGELAPGATKTCQGIYLVTQADVDAGKVVNKATAVGTNPANNGGNGDTTQTPAESTIDTVKPQPAMTLVKSGKPSNGKTVVALGDEIAYTFTVTNTGNVTLSNLVVKDAKLGASWSCSIDKLEVGASNSECKATYKVTQADVDLGRVLNEATVSGSAPSGDQPASSGESEIQTVDPQEGMEVTKTAVLPNGKTAVEKGDAITYKFVVKNTGNVTLSKVKLEDEKTAGVVCPPDAIAPGESMTCVGAQPYVVTQADVDAGKVVNTVIASGNKPDGQTTGQTPGENTVETVKAAPRLALAMAAKLPQGTTNVKLNDQIVYLFTVKNAGNVTLSDITVSDERSTGVTCPGTTLAPGESMECQGLQAYPVAQSDVDAGAVVNEARAAALAPLGQAVSDAVSGSVPTETANPELTLVKQAVLPAGKSTVDMGDKITYQFTVTNSGNVTMRNVVVTDAKLGAGWSCVIGELAVGAKHDACSGEYVVSQADIDAGVVENTAHVSGTKPGGNDGDKTETPGKVDVPTVPAKPELKMTKTADKSGQVTIGEVITYTFAVTNTGNVTMRNVTVTDPLLGDDWKCVIDEIGVHETKSCSGRYIVKQADVDRGKIVNIASVTGSNPKGGISNPTIGEVEISTAPSGPALELTKHAKLNDSNGDRVAQPGETIDYSFKVRNAGKGTVRDVRVEDPMVGRVACEKTELAAGESTTCRAQRYTVTDRDVQGSVLRNSAQAFARFESDEVASSRVANASTPTTTLPGQLPRTGGRR